MWEVLSHFRLSFVTESHRFSWISTPSFSRFIFHLSSRRDDGVLEIWAHFRMKFGRIRVPDRRTTLEKETCAILHTWYTLEDGTVCDELSANLHAEHTSEYIICRDAHCLHFFPPFLYYFSFIGTYVYGFSSPYMIVNINLKKLRKKLSHDSHDLRSWALHRTIRRGPSSWRSEGQKMKKVEGTVPIGGRGCQPLRIFNYICRKKNFLFQVITTKKK